MAIFLIVNLMIRADPNKSKTFNELKYSLV